MCKLISSILILGALSSNGQTVIRERHFENSYSDNNGAACFASEYNYKLPYLETNNKNDIKAIINDSIASIANDDFDPFNSGENCYPDFNYSDGTCDFSNVGAEERTIDYTVLFNSKNCLSLTINKHIVAGGYGHGAGDNTFFFNLDLRNNQFVLFDSLFSTKYKEKLIPYFIEKYNFNREVKSDDTTKETNDFYFIGFGITPNALKVYFYKNLYDFKSTDVFTEIPFDEIKKFINKKYLFLWDESKN